jgi:hypothetical protein
MPFDLPSGWRWHATPDDWLYAYDYAQRKYMVTKTGVREIISKQNTCGWNVANLDTKKKWEIGEEISASFLIP